MTYLGSGHCALQLEPSRSKSKLTFLLNPLRLSLDKYCHLSRNEYCMKLSWCKIDALFKDQTFIFWYFLSFCKTASHNPHARNKGKHCTTPESKTTIQTQGESFKFILISHNSRKVSHGCESKTKRVSCPTQGARSLVPVVLMGARVKP